MKFDFRISDDGELLYDNNSKDIKSCCLDDLIKQNAISAIKSITTDWFNFRSFGSNIEEFFGYSCNKKTCQDIVDRIESSLLREERLKKEDLFFVPKVIENGIEIIVFIRKLYDEGHSEIKVELDLAGEVKIHENNTQ